MHTSSSSGRCLLAAAGLLSVAAWSSAAHADVVQSPLQNVVAPATFSGIFVNVSTGETGTTSAPAGWDFSIYRSDFLYFTSPSTSTGGFVATQAAGTSNVQALSLDAGFVVDASSFVNREYAYTTFGSAPGQWRLNDTNYFGFRFMGDDGLLHYAWGTLIIGATPLDRTIGALYYESAANTAITVGAMPVPEASTLAMMLAGGGLVVGLARRRRAGAV
jgi:hypothetical protein